VVQDRAVVSTALNLWVGSIKGKEFCDHPEIFLARTLFQTTQNSIHKQIKEPIKFGGACYRADQNIFSSPL
jgi:hypothetical protein